MDLLVIEDQVRYRFGNKLSELGGVFGSGVSMPGKLRALHAQVIIIINEIFVMRLSKTNAAKAHCS